ncbi:MAG: nuclear transport factor 2 family protein [Bacteriovoracia bacterium]
MQNAANLKQELIDLEKKYWQAMQDHDLNTALDLTDFPCLIAGPQGARAVDEAEFCNLFEMHQEGLKSFEFGADTQVRLLSENAAIVTYQVDTHMEIDGEETRFRAADASTWVKRNGKWACALHAEAPLTKQ